MTPAGDPTQDFWSIVFDAWLFATVLIKSESNMRFHVWKLGRDDSGIVMFRTHCGSGTHIQGTRLVSKLNCYVFETLNVQFSSKTEFLGRYFGDLSFRKCPCGRYGPFGCSGKTSCLVTYNQETCFWKTQLFEISFKLIILIWGSSGKPLYVRGLPAGAFPSREYAFLQFEFNLKKLYDSSYLGAREVLGRCFWGNQSLIDLR